MNAPVNPQKSMVPIATDMNKRMGFNNFLKDIQGVMPTQPIMAPQMPQMPPSMPQQPMVPQIPAMPASSQAIRGGIGMPPVQGFDNGGAAGLSNVEKLLIRDHGFTLTPEGQVVSPAGQIRTVVDGKTTFSPSGSVSIPVAPDPVIPDAGPNIVGTAYGGTELTMKDGVVTPVGMDFHPNTIEKIKSGEMVNPYAKFAEPDYVAPEMPTFSTPGAADYNPFTDPNSSIYNSPPPEEEPVSTLTPIQQAAQALQQKIEDVGLETYGVRDDEYRARFDDGTSLLDQDILDQFGVSKKDFQSALRDYGNIRALSPVGTRQSAGGGFRLGLENILNPEEAQESYDARLAARKADERRDARTAAQIQRAQKASNLAKDAQGNILPGQSKSLADIKADLQAAGQDLASRPGMFMDDLSKLGSSVSQGFSDLTSGISDFFTGGRDDAPSVPVATEPYIDPMYGEEGRGGQRTFTTSAPVDFSVPYDAGEFVNANVSDLSGIPDELQVQPFTNIGTNIDPSKDLMFMGTGPAPDVTTDLGISLGGDTVDRSGVLPSSDLGRLLSGDPQVVDDVIKLLAVDPEKTKSDLLSTATTTFGDSPSRITGSGDAPVIGDVPQLGTLQNLDFTNQLQDRDMAGLGDYTGSIDLSGLPANIQGLPPSDFQAQDRQVDLSGLPTNVQELPPSDLELQRQLSENVLKGPDIDMTTIFDYDPELQQLQRKEEQDSLLSRFVEAQPEGSLQGTIFDYVPDAQQLQNFAQDLNLGSSLDNILKNIDFTSYIPPSSQGDVQPRPSLDALGNLIKNIGETNLPSFLQPDGGKGFDDPVTIGEAISNLNPFGAAEANPAVASAALKFTKNIVNDNLGKAAAVTGGALATVPLMQRVDEFIRESLGISDAAIGTIPENQKLEFTANQTGIPLAELNTIIQDEAISENPNINISGSIAPSISALQTLTAPNVDTSLPTVGLSAASIPYDAGEFAIPVDRSGNPYTVFDPATGIAIPYSSADAAQGANIIAGDNLGVGTGDALSAIEAISDSDEGFRAGPLPSSGYGQIVSSMDTTGNEAKDLSSISSITNLNDVINVEGKKDVGVGAGVGAGVLSGVGAQPIVDANVIDAAVTDLTGDDTTLPPPPPPVDVDEDDISPSVSVGTDDDDIINVPPSIPSTPSGGGSDRDKQERRDYSRIREILAERPRRIGGTAPGLGYKKVEGISNTLNKAVDDLLTAFA